jgi:transposase-like protein
MELARLRAENTRLKMERDILKKAARTSPKIICEVRMDSAKPSVLADFSEVSSA